MSSTFRTILAEIADPASVVDSIRHDHSPFHLATLADTYSPDSADSPGARFLAGIARAVADHVTDDDSDVARARLETLTDGDSAHTIADDAVPIYTHERWAVFTDLGAYNEDVSELVEVDGSDLTAAACATLYMIADRLVRALAEELSEALDEDDEDTGGVFTDLETGQQTYVVTDGAGRFRLNRADGVEIGDGFDTFAEAEAAYLNRAR